MTAAAILQRTCRPLCSLRKQLSGCGNVSRLEHISQGGSRHTRYSSVPGNTCTSQKPKLQATCASNSIAPQTLQLASADLLRIPAGNVYDQHNL